MCPPSGLTEVTSTSSLSSPLPPPNFNPSTPLSLAAYNLAAANLPPAILNHSLRVFLYASYLHSNPSSTSSSPYPSPVATTPISTTSIFTACILHDLGASTINPAFNGFQRFEICGADAAVSLMESYPDETTQAERVDVWAAISLHSSPGIAERLSPLTRLVRLAVLSDFGNKNYVKEEMKIETENDFPRSGIEKLLGDAVVGQILEKEAGEKRALKGPSATWAGGMVKSFEEGGVGEEGVNKAF